MADKKTGPVKPPILDMKARENASEKPEAQKPEPEPTKPEAPKTAAATSGGDKSGSAKDKDTGTPTGARETAKPGADGPKPSSSNTTASGTPPGGTSTPKEPAPQPASGDGNPAMPLAAAAIAGGLIGLALAYGLAYFGYWPGTPSGTSQEDLSALETRIAQVEGTLEVDAGPDSALSERIEALEAGLEETAASIASLGDAAPEPASGELEQLAQTVTELSQRVDALGTATPDAGADGTDASAFEEQFAAVEGTQQEMRSQIQDIEASMEDAQARIADLEERIADQSDFEALSAERDRLARLPAALSGLEAAIGSGTPFANELAAVSSLIPDFSPGEEIQAVASAGAPTASALLGQFRDLIPALIAARPQEPNADWFDALLDQAASALALRPTGADGDAPAALVGRTETALEAGDLQGARELIGRYPDEMARIAQPVSAGIVANLAARDLFARAQQQAQAGPAQDSQQDGQQQEGGQ